MKENRVLLADAMMRWFDSQGAQGILVTDASLRVLLWNQWLVTATGTPRELVLGRPLFDVLPSLVARGLDQYYADALAGQVNVLSYAFHRYLVPTPAGPLRTDQMPQAGRIAPLADDNGIIGTITMIEDVTERVANERELRSRIATAEAASRVKDEFLATLSHEIRTPLNAVIGWTRILRARQEPDLATVRRAIEVIDRNASAQLTLVSDMLDMARIASGKVRLEMAEVDICAVVLSAIDVVRTAADAKGVRLVTEFAQHLPAVRGDSDRLLQVIWNLLSNAVKFTEAEGQVNVGITADAKTVVVTITDSGQGIPAAFLPHVFERFKQADPSSSRRHGGLGLGLALVKELVEMHGGSVSVSSEGAGQGATFKVRLPARAAAPAAGAAGPAGVDDHAERVLTGIRIVLVEDDPDSAEIFTRAVTDAGALVACATSAPEALAWLCSGESDRPHVIVADIGMPGDDGFSFLQQLRSLPRESGGSLPVIALTAYATPEDRARALKAGFAAHLAKPFAADVLAVVIARAANANQDWP